MSDAPEKIWAYEQSGTFVRIWRADNCRKSSTEYTRADLSEAAIAAAREEGRTAGIREAASAAFKACQAAEAGYIDENSRIALRIENELRLETQKAIRALL